MITPFEEILAQAPHQPEELTLSGWQHGTEITVRVQKPSFYAMIANNAALNPLIPELDKLFVRHDRSGHSKPSNDFAKALICIARECLVEPSYAQLEEVGIHLTDDQLVELSLYATEGAEILRSFRRRTRNGAGGNGKSVSPAAEPAAAPAGSVRGVVPGSGDRAADAAPAKRRKAAPEEDRE